MVGIMDIRPVHILRLTYMKNLIMITRNLESTQTLKFRSYILDRIQHTHYSLSQSRGGPDCF